MEPTRIKRNLTAILSADVKGYSLLKGADLNVVKPSINEQKGEENGKHTKQRQARGLWFISDPVRLGFGYFMDWGNEVYSLRSQRH